MDNIIQQGIDKNIELIKQRGMGATGAVMGFVKIQLGEGGFDGKVVFDKIKSKIGEIAGNQPKAQSGDKPKGKKDADQGKGQQGGQPKAQKEQKGEGKGQQKGQNEQKQKPKPKKSSNNAGGSQK